MKRRWISACVSRRCPGPCRGAAGRVCMAHRADGYEFMPSMGGNQVSATLTLPDDTPRADAYAMADEAMDLMLTVDGVETVGAMGAAAE